MIKNYSNEILFFVGVVLVLAAVQLQYTIYATKQKNSLIDQTYAQQWDTYQTNNVYYQPLVTARTIYFHQHPNGYFVTDPDMIFEPSQLNNETFRNTRYAISAMNMLNSTARINTNAVVEYIFRHYVTQVSRFNQDVMYINQNVAGFNSLVDGVVSVRSTMDALITLNVLNRLDDKRLNLNHITDFIMLHKNDDGGFWDEYYDTFKKSSTIKTTSFAARALGIIQENQQKQITSQLTSSIDQYVMSCLNEKGFAMQPGSIDVDSYNNFRAFIAMWSMRLGTVEEKRQSILKNLDLQTFVSGLIGTYYNQETQSFNRYSGEKRGKSSLKATHLMVWLIQLAGEIDRVDRIDIARFVISNQTQKDEYGKNIYSTYSAVGILSKLNLSTKALVKPRPPIKTELIPLYIPLVLFLLAVVVFGLAYHIKKCELEKQNLILLYQVTMDGLTKIYNRQKFQTQLKHEITNVERYSRCLSVIMFDVDDFKGINDNFGHAQGDEVLVKISKTLMMIKRDADIFARWGGEEFVILTPETDLAGAKQLAEKCRKAIEALVYSFPRAVTASFGVAEYKAGYTLDLMGNVDEALYVSKTSGKNRVSCFE